jgi:Holliday junction resolvase
MATNYQRGYAFEMRVKETMEKFGLKTFRMAGSHSEADLIGISEFGVSYLVQCKRNGQISVEEWNQLRKTALSVKGIPILAYIPESGRGVELRVIVADAEKGERNRIALKTRAIEPLQK